jgi:hypothetical protein
MELIAAKPVTSLHPPAFLWDAAMSNSIPTRYADPGDFETRQVLASGIRDHLRCDGSDCPLHDCDDVSGASDAGSGIGGALGVSSRFSGLKPTVNTGGAHGIE